MLKQYTYTMVEKLASAVRKVDESSTAWIEEQRKSHKLNETLLRVGETVEHQANSFNNVLKLSNAIFRRRGTYYLERLCSHVRSPAL